MMAEKELLLYHGSYTAVPAIDLNMCYSGLDFGKGFYLTTSRQQAVNFIPNAIKKAYSKRAVPRNFSVDQGQLSCYKYQADNDLKILSFPEADIDWLHFVAAHRNGALFKEIVEKYKDYDLIIGKIADDQTAMTLVAYVSGAYGEPGTYEADQIAINFLLPNKLKDQYCFRTEKALSYLQYLGSESYAKCKGK